MNFVQTELAPIPAGHYSQATVAHGFVFVAGQLPIVPGPDRIIPDGIKANCVQPCLAIASRTAGIAMPYHQSPI